MQKHIMAKKKTNLSAFDADALPSAEGLCFGIVVSKWNNSITSALAQGCLDTLLEQGAKQEDIVQIEVPGAFELPSGAGLLLRNKKLHAVICLGCVIKGETSHNEYINQSVAIALQQLSLQTGIPCIFGLLTPNTQEQAEDRAGGKHGNKGVEAAVTAIEMAALAKQLAKNEGKIGFGSVKA